MWVLGIFLSILFDLLVLDLIMIGISYGLSFPKNPTIWKIFRMNGFAELKQTVQLIEHSHLH